MPGEARRVVKSLWLLCVALGLAASCGGGRASTTADGTATGTLTVYAASSLTDAFKEIGTAFDAAHPGVHTEFNFAGSQVLATQIEQGAKADVFASADVRWMRYAEEQQLIAGTPVVFARNQLVVVIPRSNPGQVRRLQDLERSGVKLVLAGRQVPAGVYAREALSRLSGSPGFSKTYEQNVLANLVSEEENVRAVAAKVQLREADAGIVYQTDVTAAGDKAEGVEIPADINVLAEYPIAVTKDAPSEAQKFVNFLYADQGQQDFADAGYRPVVKSVFDKTGARSRRELLARALGS